MCSHSVKLEYITPICWRFDGHALSMNFCVVFPTVANHVVGAQMQHKGKKVKADIALHGNPISELQDVTCHMGSRSVTCHPPDTSERAPSNPSHAGWYSIYLPRRDGRLSWPSWLAPRPGVEPATFSSWVRRRTAAPPTQRRSQTRCVRCLPPARKMRKFYCITVFGWGSALNPTFTSFIMWIKIT